MFGADSTMKIWKAGCCTTEGHKLGKQLLPFLIHPFSNRATGPNNSPTLRVSQVHKRRNPHHCPQPGTALQGLYPEHKCHMSTKGTVKILTVLGEVLAHGKATAQTSLCFPPLPPPPLLHWNFAQPEDVLSPQKKHCVHMSSKHASTPLCPPESYARKVILVNSIQLRWAFLSLQITTILCLLPFFHHRHRRLMVKRISWGCTAPQPSITTSTRRKAILLDTVRMSYVHREIYIYIF